jgi:CheY-like chemotaxis protein
MEAIRILVAEHEPRLRSTLRFGLQQAGYLVADAPDGKKALEIIREEPPEVLLLDLRIPIIGSVALLAELRTTRSRQQPRAVALAERDDLALAIEAVRLGASDILEKPLDVTHARASIESVLREPPLERGDFEGEHGDVLEAVRVALQTGRFGTVEPAVLGPGMLSEAACLNLAGIVQEAHGRSASALKLYQRAALADSQYWPACENLQRLQELREDGASSRPVCFREVGPVATGHGPLCGGNVSPYASRL